MDVKSCNDDPPFVAVSKSELRIVHVEPFQILSIEQYLFLLFPYALNMSSLASQWLWLKLCAFHNYISKDNLQFY